MNHVRAIVVATPCRFDVFLNSASCDGLRSTRTTQRLSRGRSRRSASPNVYSMTALGVLSTLTQTRLCSSAVGRRLCGRRSAWSRSPSRYPRAPDVRSVATVLGHGLHLNDWCSAVQRSGRFSWATQIPTALVDSDERRNNRSGHPTPATHVAIPSHVPYHLRQTLRRSEPQSRAAEPLSIHLLD